MIHDIVISCLSLQSETLPIDEFLASGIAKKFLHPCEEAVLQNISQIINLLRGIAKFSKKYGGFDENFLQQPLTDTDQPLQKGLYLKAFANGLETALLGYFADMVELESIYVKNTSESLLFIYQRLQVYEPLALYLEKLIQGIKLNKLHGCKIYQYLHQNSQHGDPKICAALHSIQMSVKVVFFKQLTHWIIYAKVIDPYKEFFIQCSDEHNKTTSSDKSVKHINSTLSEAITPYADIWQYEVCFDLLPHYLSSAWAEKVLFIGQTVLIFRLDINEANKLAFVWNEDEMNSLKAENSLWNKNEQLYYKKIEGLKNDIQSNMQQYESVIDEIKSYVTNRLSEIAINRADLVHQLKLIKDYFLLGRGELFLEFIRQTCNIDKDKNEENKMQDVLKAFESAANALGISDELEQFIFIGIKTPLSDSSIANFDMEFMNRVQLQYKINWPLHLLFSPNVVERYNILFRFLLSLKKVQYELHILWCKQKKIKTPKTTQFVKAMHLCNQLMFFVDNLQYYIQVDVLESQFSMLMNTILNKADFEQIQKAHSIFQANILSLCFLWTIEDANKLTTSTARDNPINKVLMDVLQLCGELCCLMRLGLHTEDFTYTLKQLEDRFDDLTDQLTNLLVALKSTPSTKHLSQFLLRLDFNHWFSLRKKNAQKEKSDTTSTHESLFN